MWYVEYLLLHREEIKITDDLESDLYLDLLSVDSTLEKLLSNDLVTDEEVAVLNRFINMEDFGIYDVPKIEKYPTTITKIFVGICAKISAILGGVFTNAGYLDYIQRKYNLSDEQVRKLEAFMLSEFRHKILTKPYTKKEK